MAIEKLESVGIDVICELIENGKTQREIADLYKVSVGTLNNFIHRPENLELSACAMKKSAEGWLDRGLNALETAERDSNEIARARAIAQECARRAAIRNPKYSEKQSVTLSGDKENPIAIEVSQRPQLSREEWLRLHGIEPAGVIESK